MPRRAPRSVQAPRPRRAAHGSRPRRPGRFVSPAAARSRRVPRPRAYRGARRRRIRSRAPGSSCCPSPSLRPSGRRGRGRADRTVTMHLSQAGSCEVTTAQTGRPECDLCGVRPRSTGPSNDTPSGQFDGRSNPNPDAENTSSLFDGDRLAWFPNNVGSRCFAGVARVETFSSRKVTATIGPRAMTHSSPDTRLRRDGHRRVDDAGLSHRTEGRRAAGRQRAGRPPTPSRLRSGARPARARAAGA